MKVLMISTDRKVLEANSVVADRMREYAEAFGELRIIVFSTMVTDCIELSPKCFVYSSGSRSKFLYIFDAVRIGSQILKKSFSTINDWVITTQDPFETGIVGLTLAKRFSLKLNVQVHTDFLSPYFTQKSKLNSVRLFLARYVLPRAVSIRVVSERIRKSLLQVKQYKLNDSSIITLPIYSESVNTPSLSSDRFPQFDKVVLMVSRLEPEKDIVTALRVFALLEKSVKNVGLVIVGSGSMEAELSHSAQDLGVGEKVIFVGWRDVSELAIIRASSDVFLSTSLFEGYGLSLVEAAAAKMPIVSTDVGIAPELLAKDRLARPGDVEGFTRLLVEALEHPERFVANTEGLAQVTYKSKEEYLKRLNQSLLV